MLPPTPSDTELIQQAATLMARLMADNASAHDQQVVSQWRSMDARHEAIWQKLLQIPDKFTALPESINSHVLVRQPAIKRRQLLQWFGVGTGLAYATWYGADQRLAQRYLADYRTAIGETRQFALQDGSQLHLNTNSSVDIRFNTLQRKVVLHNGEILMATGHETPRRPFFVETRFGRVTALGTQFVVRQLDKSIRVQVEEGLVEVQPTKGGVMRITAREQLEFSANTIGQIQTLTQNTNNTAWRDGLLVAEHMRLADFAAEISRYRQGVLRCDERIANLQISGVFSLKDTDRALANAAASLPVSVQYRTRYWVNLTPEGKSK